MTITAGSRAWRFLRRNPRYIEAWRAAAEIPGPAETAPFPLRAQTEADREAAAWGLLAWEDPLAEDGPASPFWTEAPMEEGKAAPPGGPTLAEALLAPEGRLSGLRLDSGAVILKAEQGDAAAQVRVAEGESFDPWGGLAFQLTFGLRLTSRITRIGDLWAIVAARPKKVAAPHVATMSCIWRWAALSPASPTAS